jgi:signal transduction histidine kinase
VTLRLRFTLLFVALLGGLLLLLVGLRQWQSRYWTEIATAEMRERETLLRELTRLETDSGRLFSRDYAQWDEMMEFVNKPTKEWARINIDDSLEDFHITCAWVYKPDGSLIYSACWPEPDKPLESPLTPAQLRTLFTRRTFDFFQERDGMLHEIHGAAIVPSDDPERAQAPAGFLMIAKHWDSAKLREMEPITQGNLLAKASLDPTALPERTAAVPLAGLDGQPVAWLTLTYNVGEAGLIESQDTVELIAVALIALAALMLFWWCLRAWVLRPLALIGQSIATDDDHALAPFQSMGDEIGSLARLVGDSQDQRVLLREALDERVRIGRDLHDGAIQRIYSCGMNLASARSLLRSDPPAAERILSDSLGHMNEMIGELRAFIHRLEPEQPKAQPVSEVLRALLAPATGKLQHEISVDDALAARLDSRQRGHLLFFLSEAISNVVRHAQARTLRITLRAEGTGARLEVVDDGVGFDPAQVPGGRQGQRNLAARARELGAVLRVDSAPGRGTRITLDLPPEALGAK